jgi:superfamily I DNA/RNA helicase
LIHTPEQNEILYSENDFLYVLARAGTGKTTTLAQYTRLRKKSSFLYIVYNSSIREEAINKFPAYVNVQTIHSLAYSFIGKKYKDKLTFNLKVEDIFNNSPFFKDLKLNDEEVYKKAYTIVQIINGFCNSSLNSISEIDHLHHYKEIAIDYWNRMIDINNKSVCITHDGYLKVYHLSKPKLDYDYILIDESQDSNEVMLDIVYAQDSKKIFVGDEHQRIYSFRGAVNVFNEEKYFKVNSDYRRLSLTESFRFGQDIADIANTLLSLYKNEDVLLNGTDKDSFIGTLDRTIQYTSISRTNSKLFDLAVDHVRRGRTIHIVGGADFIFNQITDAYHLYKGERDKIKSEYLKTFKNYKSFKGMATSLKVPEYVFLIKVIEKYGNTLDETFRLIKRGLTSIRTADRILSTAHKSKGLEFLSVKLEDDFISLYDDNGILIPPNRVDPEEINILYVALTRATDELELNKDLQKLIFSQ